MVGAAALVLGAVDSYIKGQGAGLPGALSRTAAPWLLLAFVAGACASTRQLSVGAFIGLEATLLALFGFYLINSLIFPIGADGWIADYRIALQSGATYFWLALVSGPLFGALGAWWRQRLSMAPVFALGIVFILEAIEQASRASFFVQYADQVSLIEVALGVAWIVFARGATRVLRQRSGARRLPRT
jgi:hypothetical protein